MKGLRKAIYTKFASVQTAGSLYALTGGRMQHGRMRSDWDMPYIVYQLGNVRPVSTYDDGPAHRVLRVSFVVLDDTSIHSSSTAETIVTAVEALYNDAVLTYAASTSTHIAITWQNTIPPEFVADDAGGGAWQAVVMYEAFLKEA